MPSQHHVAATGHMPGANQPLLNLVFRDENSQIMLPLLSCHVGGFAFRFRVHIYGHAHTCTHMYTHAHTCTHTYAHIYTHTHAHTPVHLFVSSPIHSFNQAFPPIHIHSLVRSFVDGLIEG
eukprot:GHVU01231136.1.p1 GENE.GHVU01231136.1~~GHVU01231136.1.p1  ORF type:complete len:121 (-),score=0.71 GHVU01231136.1:248-610(-)